MRILPINSTNNQTKVNIAFASKNAYVSALKKAAKNDAPKIDVNAFFSDAKKLELIERNKRISGEESEFTRGNKYNTQTLTTMTPFGPNGGKWTHEIY